MIPTRSELQEVIKTSNVKWLDRIIYKNLGQLQANLNNTERAMLVDQLATSMALYERLALGVTTVRHALYRHYNVLIKSGAATSQLSRRFNMSKKGFNREIRDQIDSAFKQAHWHEQEDRLEEAATCLRRAQLSYKVLFDEEMVIALLCGDCAEAEAELARIAQFREVLFLSAIKLAASVAKAHDLSLSGNAVEWSDLVQEAIIGTMQAVQAYHPIESGQTFTSFVRTWVSGIVSKRISETTRTVPVPRTVIDRYDYVNKAILHLGLTVTDLRGGVHEGSVLVEGKVDNETLDRIAYCATALQAGQEDEECHIDQTARRPYNRGEVMYLLKVTQETLSLDVKVASHSGEEGEADSLGNVLADDAPTVEEAYDGERVSSRLMAILYQFTSEEEYAIMKLRYGMKTEAVVGCGRVSDQYCATIDAPMNKSRVAEIDQEVLDRVREAAAEDPDLVRQLREIWRTVPFMEKR